MCHSTKFIDIRNRLHFYYVIDIFRKRSKTCILKGYVCYSIESCEHDSSSRPVLRRQTDIRFIQKDKSQKLIYLKVILIKSCLKSKHFFAKAFDLFEDDYTYRVRFKSAKTIRLGNASHQQNTIHIKMRLYVQYLMIVWKQM